MPSLAIAGGAPLRRTPFTPWPQYDGQERDALLGVLEGRNWGGYPFTNTLARRFGEAFAAAHWARYGICAANGTQNVLAVRMPYKTSCQESLDDAGLVIDALGVQSLTLPISEMADPLIERFPEMNAMRKGNIMARLRMVVLYDQSAAFNGLVVGTGNKTEILLGYTTLWGDMAAAINPLGDLYKTQLRQLAASLGLPPSVLNKPPSADLWAGQT